MRKTHNFAQMQIDEIIHIGDTVVDATIKAGDGTRYLASRVGDGGHVLAFSDQKKDIDDMAASLFLSGLTARVEPIEKPFKNIPEYLTPTELISVFLFQIDRQTDASALCQTIQQIQLYLRNLGVIVLDGHHQDPAMQESLILAKRLPTNTYDVRYFYDVLSDEAALILQRR